MTPNGAAEEPVVLRYRLTSEHGRQALRSNVRENLAFWIGLLILLPLCAFWAPLGHAGPPAALLMLLSAGYWLWSVLRRQRRALALYGTRDLEVVLDARALRIDTGLSRSEIPWTTFARIERGAPLWVFRTKVGSSFFIPAEVIFPEARALIERCAWAAGVRLR